MVDELRPVLHRHLDKASVVEYLLYFTDELPNEFGVFDPLELHARQDLDEVPEKRSVDTFQVGVGDVVADTVRDDAAYSLSHVHHES